MPSVDDLWEGLSRRAREAERARGVKRWVARWRTADGKTRKKRFHTRDEALTHALSHEGEGHATDAAPAPPTVADAVAEYVHSKRHLSPRGLENVQLHAGHVTKALGTITLADLTREHVEDWLASLSDVAPSSRAKRLTLLRQALDHYGASPEPTRGLVVRQETTEQGFVSLSELAAMARAARTCAPSKHGPKGEREHGAMWEAMILLMGTVGPRVSEVTALKVGNLDRKNSTLRIEGTKTAASRRTVPISAKLVEILAAVAGDRPGDELLFCTKEGTPISRERVGQRVREASERALGRRIRAHDLRHSAATLLIEHGGLLVASRILGHADASITARIYGHVQRSQLVRTQFTIGEHLSGAIHQARLEAGEVVLPPRDDPKPDDPF